MTPLLTGMVMAGISGAGIGEQVGRMRGGPRLQLGYALLGGGLAVESVSLSTAFEMAGIF